MKKSITFLIFMLLVASAFAQKGKVTSALNLISTGKLDKAHEAIELAVDPANAKSEKTINWPKTWEVRGDLYQAIGQSNDDKIKALSKDPFTEALNSYKKAVELDVKNKYSKSLKIKLTMLTNDLSNKAVKAYRSEKYEESLNAFEQVLEINDMDLVKADNPNVIDTAIIFNAGLVASFAKNYDKAIEHYTHAAKYGYKGAETVSRIANIYKLKKDTISALEVLKKGFETYPEDNGVLTNLTQVYIELNKVDDAMKYLDLAISQDPQNVTYYFAKGALYEKMNEGEKAIETYEKAIEVDEKFFNAYYNLGVMYYNRGVQQIEAAKDIPPGENEKYHAEMKKADVWFEKSLPYMEKCLELKPEDHFTIESLKNLYYRMIPKNKSLFEAKYAEMEKRLN